MSLSLAEWITLKIKKELFALVSPSLPKETRLNTASGKAEGLLSDEYVTALFVLSHDPEEDIREAAEGGFRILTEKKLIEALSVRIAPEVIRKIYDNFKSREIILNMLALSECTDDGTLMELAKDGSDSVLELVSHSAKLIGNIELLNIIKSNANILPLIAEQAERTFNLPPGDAGAEFDSLPEALIGEDEELEESQALNLYQAVQQMTVVEKVKLAIKGNKEARGLLIKSSNKIVARTVIRNPRITDEEIATIAASKSASEEILREMVRNDEWTKNYMIRRALTFNPKTPLPAAIKMVNALREKDVRDISKSRAVPNAVRAAARRLIEARKFR